MQLIIIENQENRKCMSCKYVISALKLLFSQVIYQLITSKHSMA